MPTEQRSLWGWGRYLPTESLVHIPANAAQLATSELPENRLIARGLGRSYGDPAQRTDGSVVVTPDCDTVRWVDRDAGIVQADAGVSIGQLIDRFAPKGWFVPVTPGTRFVTIGGAIAADIHGKNHHVDGSFGDHVLSLRLRLASDDVVSISPTDDAELFWATVGGMGLTGIIVDAVVQLTPIPSSRIRVETQRFPELAPLLAEMRASDEQHAFSVAWVDLLKNARSVLTQGSFASTEQVAQLGAASPAGPLQQPPSPSIGLPPLPLPRFAVTPAVRAFNELWFHKAPSTPTVTAESITAFFHPLDAITDWNRVYGGTGFVQWQCVIPDQATASLEELTKRFAKLPAFFSVLKRFGPGNQSPLSFPSPGWTLAVDLPATRSALAGLGDLDRIVADVGGRLYLAKDARMSRTMFEQTYPRRDEFRAVRDRVDPGRRFSSDLSVRLGL